MTGLTTHALDTALGTGAEGLAVVLTRDGGTIAEARLDAQGRARLTETLERGTYELTFSVADYHRAKGVAIADPPFLDHVTIRFGVAEPTAHYHVPLLVSPYGYSTYRGS